MHTFIKKFLGFILLLSCSGLLAVTPYYSIRSQAENAARELAGAGWATQINRCDREDIYGNFSITPEYTRSFKSYHIGKCLFGCCNSNCCYPCGSNCNTSCCYQCASSCNTCCDDNCTIIRISGSQVPNRGACDWLADYFGLPTDYKSCVTFEPRIDNFLIDFNLFVGIECCKGLYFRFNLPVVHTRWNLNMCECIEDKGVNDHWAGYFSDTLNLNSTGTVGILRSNLVSSFCSFITGSGTITDPTITFNRLCYAKMCPCNQSKTQLAEIDATVGWNFWREEDYHLGLNVRAAAPAGSRPAATYLFEPIVGNGHHWEVGGGLTTHWVFWKKAEEIECALYFDANVTHLFQTKQCRTFDLRCNPLSRYMLAAKFDRPVEDLLAGDVTPIKQFKGIYTPVANLTTFSVDVSADIQADIALKLQVAYNNLGLDLGYNFWARSCERIDFNCDCLCPFEENTWALKGDSFMYGYYITGGAVQKAVALSATQSGATICRGLNNYPDGDIAAGIAWWRSPGVDFRQLAYDASAHALYTFSPNFSNNTVYTSLQPQFISFCDIDCESARTRGLSHKIFGSIDYTWRDNERWIPYLGLGFEIEFAHNTFDDGCDLCCFPCNINGNSCGNCCYPCDRCCNDSCCCQYCALSQWGIWLKGGVAF